MTTLVAGYRVKESLYSSDRSLIYRGCRERDDQPVILKILRQAYPSPENIARFTQEYEIIRNLNASGVVNVYELIMDQHRPVMVLEDFGGASLDRVIEDRQLSLSEFLQLALQIVEIVEQVHRRHVIHKDINPSNLVWNSITGQLRLIDFGISTVLTREEPMLSHPSGMMGTLAYMSPEQTGRMNRAVDYRTDFYSLGVTFYELLTGQLPFASTDAMALVHAHIAQQPTALHVHRPDIPQPIAAMVMKLMAKNAEDRYQSAYGLQSDLEECQRQWQAAKRITSFRPGQHDVAEQFQIPQKLYGRETEIRMLLAAFERVRRGASEIMLVSGYAGVGKSALVREIYKPMSQQQGYFISGKFDQYQRNIPYLALTQAFRALVRQLLTESEDQVTVWRDDLSTAVGPNGRVLLDIIPEVELLIGPQPAIPDLPPTQAQNRLNVVLQSFVRVFARAGHPLVLFLDDLQWSDIASLNLLQRLMMAPSSAYLFVIGAYRDDDVHQAHPLPAVLDEMRKAGCRVHHLPLQPLQAPDVEQLVANALHCPPDKARPLAHMVLAKTDGNPFFVNVFLQSLYTEGLLRFEGQRGQWQWDVGQIQAQNITDNVVELIAQKVQRLGHATQHVLQLAACLGNQFDLQTLAIVAGKTPQETAKDLWQALTEGVILPLGEAYKFMALEIRGLSEEVKAEYKFPHDRLQQALYSLIPAQDKPAMHWQIGRRLWQQLPVDELDLKLFDVVNQLNLGVASIDDQAAQDELAALNLTAGKKAKVAAAYEPAFNYLQAGLEILSGTQGWERQYGLTLELHVEAAEAAYSSGQFEQMGHLIETVLGCATTLLDKIKAYELKIHAGFATPDSFADGIRDGLACLAMLGLQLPEKPSLTDLERGLEETQRALTGKTIESLLDLPEMTAPHQLAIMGILVRLSPTTYRVAPELFQLIAFSAITLSVNYGNTPWAPWAYAVYGIILCIRGDIDAGYAFGNLALNLQERSGARETKSHVHYIVNTFIRPWKEHIRDTLQSTLNIYNIGLETGSLVYAAQSLTSYTLKSYCVGQPLNVMASETSKHIDMMRFLNQRIVMNTQKLYRQVILNLIGEPDRPYLLVGESYNEEERVPVLLEERNSNELYHIYFHKLILSYLFRDYEQAVENSNMTKKYVSGGMGMGIPISNYYDSLARLAVCSGAPESEQEYLHHQVATNQEKMRQWSEHAPMNYLHKYYLIEAERARVLGHESEARDYYDRAIDLAGEHEYVNDVALANELAAMFYLGRNQSRIAYHYLRDAHYAYLHWGALAKVRDLEVRYPQLWTQAVPDLQRLSFNAAATRTGQRVSSDLDLASILKASQAISSEIVLDKLLDKLMRIVIENAGAQKGCLILEQQDQLVVVAEGEAETDEVMVLQSVPVDSRPDLPVTLIRYVERTREEVVLSNATQEGMFTADPYIAAYQPRSILCAPLVNQGKLTGILYLENNITAAAFTPDRLAVLNLLSSQEAISIENASLYRCLQEANTQLEDYNRTLEERVADRTHELHEKNRELEIVNQQILAATERKMQFFNNMSHELRTPLDAVIGFSEVLQEQAFGELNDKQEEYVDYILASGNHLLSLINDLLDLAKLDAGMMELQPETFPLKPLTESCLVMVRERASERNIILSLEVAEDIDTVVGDERRVKQILLNLLSNAVKFTPDQGRVGIKATRNAARAHIAVWDTGVGIAPADQQRIFEEFQQVEDKHATKRVGTGLGLALTKKFVELHGGTIEVESHPGQGSTFTFSLSVAETF